MQQAFLQRWFLEYLISGFFDKHSPKNGLKMQFSVTIYYANSYLRKSLLENKNNFCYVLARWLFYIIE